MNWTHVIYLSNTRLSVFDERDLMHLHFTLYSQARNFEISQYGILCSICYATLLLLSVGFDKKVYKLIASTSKLDMYNEPW